MEDLKYEYMNQESRKYEYGPGKEFKTQEEAHNAAKLLLQKTLTSLSLAVLWKSIEECKIDGEGTKENGYYKVIFIIKIPKLFE